MDVNSVLITDSQVNMVTGGGIVSYNLAEALRSCSNLRYILSTGKPFEDNVFTINPLNYGYTQSDPFFIDYMAHSLLKNEPTELFMTYGCPFGLTIEKAKRDFFCKIVCDLAPHNIDISKEEHIRFTGQYNYSHLIDGQLWGLYSKHLRLADKVIVHSKKGAEYIEKKAQLKETPTIIPHGCYPPDEIPAYPEQPIPGYFGSFGYDKGIFYMINAWVRTPHPADTQFLLGGSNTEGFCLEAPEMNKQFKPLGFIENISDFYKQISIYIQASVTEGFGIPILDAMAHGRPVIVAEGAGASELVTDGKDGFVVPIRDIKAITDKIIYFQDNPSEIQRMGAEARKLAEKYTWERMRERYVAVYNSL